MNKKGLVIQLTGLSGAGKTTLSNAVEGYFKENNIRIAIVDGDVYRQHLCADLGFSKADRIENINRLGKHADSLADENEVVLIAAINPYNEARKKLKEIYNAHLIYINSDLDTLIQRDTKGLYKKAMLPDDNPNKINHFTGISDPFDIPIEADLVIDTAKLGIVKSNELLCDYIVNELNTKKLFDSFLIELDPLIKFILNNTSSEENMKVLSKKKHYLMNVFSLGLLEFYEVIYQFSENTTSIFDWLLQQNGKLELVHKIKTYNNLVDNKEVDSKYFNKIITDEQYNFWEENGYIQLSGLIDENECDKVVTYICNLLNINDTMSYDELNNIDLQGIMVNKFDYKESSTLRNHELVKMIYEDLYQSNEIISEIAPLGFNPPVSKSYSFRGSSLHWDIDFTKEEFTNIQGLIYLNDVDEDGGAFSLIKGFNKEFTVFNVNAQNAQSILESLLKNRDVTPLKGKKGDLILWKETIPHAATPNHSDVPRFVQYLNFVNLI